MFPGVYGFEWTTGHLIFLGVFYTVLLTVATTVALALRRAVRAHRARKVESIRWHADFHDLALADRACRHDIDGAIPGRTCDNAFDCRSCATHARVEASRAAAPAADRLYHRGHTWVERQPDGTVLVGLDELGSRLTGRPERFEVPPPGTRLQVNGTAWRFGRNGTSARVLSPVDGVVEETGGPDAGWYLKIRPEGNDFRHLLSASEAKLWMVRETDRMMVLLGVPATGPALADGGALVEDAPSAMPGADWDAVWGALFLEP